MTAFEHKEITEAAIGAAFEVHNTLERISKLMSLVLRHKPERLGLVLDENGWIDVDQFLVTMQGQDFDVDRQLLEQVATTTTGTGLHSMRTKLESVQTRAIRLKSMSNWRRRFLRQFCCTAPLKSFSTQSENRG